MYVLFRRESVAFLFIFSVHISPGLVAQNGIQPTKMLILLYRLCCFVHEGKHGNLIPPVRQPGALWNQQG